MARRAKEKSMENSDFSLFGVYVAALAGMAVGFVWYSPGVFGKKWIALMGISEAECKENKKKGMFKTLLLAYVNLLIMAFVMEYVFVAVQAKTLGDAFWISVLIWAGFVATVLFGAVLWEKKPMGVFNINALHYLATMIVMALILFKL